MDDAIKCDICKNFQECRSYDSIEFGTWDTATSQDWESGKEWKLCRKCKRDMRILIDKMCKKGTVLTDSEVNHGN